MLAYNAVLDGEVVAFTPDGRPSFERLQRRMNLRDEHMARRMSGQVPVCYMVFDLLSVDGEDLTGLPLTERQRRLDQIIVPSDWFRPSEILGSSGTAVFAAATDSQLEGVIGKRRSSVYRSGRRSDEWVKLKVRRQADCVIGGWLPKSDSPTGSEPFSLLAGLWDGSSLHWVARVGSGLTATERAVLAARFDELTTDACPFLPVADLPRNAHWVRPQLVCTIEFTEMTEAGRMRAPTYQGRNETADPRRCLLSDVGRGGVDERDDI